MDKDLLLKDLSARLSHGVKIQGINPDNEVVIEELFSIGVGEVIDCNMITLSDVKPYLFPLSSMTDEQTEELIKLINTGQNDNNEFMRSLCRIEFYHKNHFDYRGLIPMGLANDATGKNIY